MRFVARRSTLRSPCVRSQAINEDIQLGGLNASTRTLVCHAELACGVGNQFMQLHTPFTRPY